MIVRTGLTYVTYNIWTASMKVLYTFNLFQLTRNKIFNCQSKRMLAIIWLYLVCHIIPPANRIYFGIYNDNERGKCFIHIKLNQRAHLCS